MNKKKILTSTVALFLLIAIYNVRSRSSNTTVSYSIDIATRQPNISELAEVLSEVSREQHQTNEEKAEMYAISQDALENELAMQVKSGLESQFNADVELQRKEIADIEASLEFIS